MTQWRSLDDILDAFSLTKPSSFPTARAELLRLLADIHPDRNAGQFNEKRYYEIRDAMDYLEKSERTSPQNLPATYESTSQLPARWQAIKATESNLSRSIEQRTKAKFRQTKIASAVVGG